MREIPDELTHGPFTVSRGSELGLSLEVMSGRRFRSPWPGVRVVAEAPDTYAERCRAASLILPVSGGLLPRHRGRTGRLARPAERERQTEHVSCPRARPDPAHPCVGSVGRGASSGPRDDRTPGRPGTWRRGRARGDADHVWMADMVRPRRERRLGRGPRHPRGRASATIRARRGGDAHRSARGMGARAGEPRFSGSHCHAAATGSTRRWRRGSD